MPYRIINVDNEEEKVVRENLHVVITAKDNRYVLFGDDFMENVSILAEVRDEEKISFEILTEDEWRERKVGDELNYNDCYKKYFENEINDRIATAYELNDYLSSGEMGDIEIEAKIEATEYFIDRFDDIRKATLVYEDSGDDFDRGNLRFDSVLASLLESIKCSDYLQDIDVYIYITNKTKPDIPQWLEEKIEEWDNQRQNKNRSKTGWCRCPYAKSRDEKACLGCEWADMKAIATECQLRESSDTLMLCMSGVTGSEGRKGDDWSEVNRVKNDQLDHIQSKIDRNAIIKSNELKNFEQELIDNWDKTKNQTEMLRDCNINLGTWRRIFDLNRMVDKKSIYNMAVGMKLPWDTIEELASVKGYFLNTDYVMIDAIMCWIAIMEYKMEIDGKIVTINNIWASIIATAYGAEGFYQIKNYKEK